MPRAAEGDSTRSAQWLCCFAAPRAPPPLQQDSRAALLPRLPGASSLHAVHADILAGQGGIGIHAGADTIATSVHPTATAAAAAAAAAGMAVRVAPAKATALACPLEQIQIQRPDLVLPLLLPPSIPRLTVLATCSTPPPSSSPPPPLLLPSSSPQRTQRYQRSPSSPSACPYHWQLGNSPSEQLQRC